MEYTGKVKLDKRTKNLVKRLTPFDIALIDHLDLDRVTAESLVETKVKVVINADSFISGRYPNQGPLILSQRGIHLIDSVGPEIFERIREGSVVQVKGNKIFFKGKEIARGKVLTKKTIEKKMENARKRIGKELESFAINTLSYIQDEKELLFGEIEIPRLKVDFFKRHVLVVVRGYDYKKDLRALRPYIRDVKPVLIGVDGGADALLEEGFKPDIIIGDMDSVSDKALLSGAELVVHAYSNGYAPGVKRLLKLGLEPKIFRSPGTSEDISLLLAYENGPDLIVAVGTHANLIEFLDKGRKGMSSTFLVRLKVGEKLVDAKGVSKLYQSRVKISHFLLLFLATLTTFSAIVLASPWVKGFIRLLIMKIQLWLRF